MEVCLNDGKVSNLLFVADADEFVCFHSGLTLHMTSFLSYRDGIWVQQVAQYSLLDCCFTEI